MARSRKLRRGIYLLPTLFTLGNLFCGYTSVIRAVHEALPQAALLIVIAAVLDGLDGRIARLTGTTSDFGVEFDSMADLLSFGIAPALLMYQWALRPLGRLGWLAAFIFVVCAATRLARFNIRSSVEDRRYFAGLPSPMAAVTLASVAFAFPGEARADWSATFLAIFTAGSGLMMISRFRYRSFKEFDLRDRRSYVYVLPLAAAIAAVALVPRWALLALALAYVGSAPAAYGWSVARRRRAQPGTADGIVDESGR